MLPLGLLARPFGSLFFGWIGDIYGRRYALFCSLLGMALVSIGLGCLPTYKDIGILAPALLALGRMLQNFFSAGETTGGAIFVLEHTTSSQRSLISSIYGVSTMVGIVIASAFVAFLSGLGNVEKGWRLLFWLGGSTAILGVFLRLQGDDSIEFKNAQSLQEKEKISVLQVLKKHKKILAAVIFTSGFSHATYSLPFTLMNGYIPLVTTLTKADVVKANTELLIVDMFLLPCFGYLANKIGKEKVMLSGAFLSITAALPLFYSLQNASFATVIMVRLVIVILGVAFAAPYYAWALERISPTYRYTILSLGSALGSLLIGTPTSCICLWLYQQMEWISAPGLYLMVIAALAIYSMRSFNALPQPLHESYA